MSTTSSSRRLHTLRRRALLPPGDGRAAPRPTAPPAPRSPRLPPRVVDAVLTALALLLAVWNSLQNPYLGPAAPWANLLLGALSALPLLARRRAPELVLAVGLLTKVFQVSLFVLPLAYYAEGACRGPHSRRTAWASAGVGLVVLAPWQADVWSSPRTVLSWFAVNFVFACLVPLLLGLYVGQRRAVVAGLVERAERAEREQRLVAEAARAQERQRIAGEMHDVVSHQVSLIVVHANALGAVAHDPETTRRTAEIIRTAGRRALSELREMLGLLRNGPVTGTEAAPAVTGSHDDPVQGEVDEVGEVADRPAGTGVVDGITELAESSRAAGLPVALHIEGTPPVLAEPVERAAQRVVQESLTNVHKHAPGATTRIRLAFAPDAVRIRIVNDPPERPAAPAADGEEPLLPSGGHGLIGLTERVRLAGGTIESGPSSDGGFRIEATLPASAATVPTP